MNIAAFVTKLRKLAAVLAKPLSRRALLTHGVAASVEHTAVLRMLGQISTVVDIGANRGQFALAARQQFPAAHIISFEPLPQPVATYRSLFANDACTALHQAAIGPQSGRVEIHISQRDDSSSLLPIGRMQNTLFPGTAEVGTALVEMGPLEKFLANEKIQTPAVLKLDVQGFELQALLGCETQLAQFSWVYAECSFIQLYDGQALASEVMAWLHDRGFNICGIYNTVCDLEGRAVQADFLFKTSGERHSLLQTSVQATSTKMDFQ